MVTARAERDEHELSPELLDLARAGERRGRAALVATLGPTVWALCRRLDPEPEDAYQEAWAHLFRALPRFADDGPASLRTWCVRVVRRRLVDRHRRARVRGIVGHLAPEQLEEHPGRGLDPEARAARSQRQARLEAALQRLPAAQRRVVVLHHLHGVPLAELAVDEGVAEGTVKSRLHRGRARLAGLLEEEL